MKDYILLVAILGIFYLVNRYFGNPIKEFFNKRHNAVKSYPEGTLVICTSAKGHVIKYEKGSAFSTLVEALTFAKETVLESYSLEDDIFEDVMDNFFKKYKLEIWPKFFNVYEFNVGEMNVISRLYYERVIIELYDKILIFKNEQILREAIANHIGGSEDILDYASIKL